MGLKFLLPLSFFLVSLVSAQAVPAEKTPINKNEKIEEKMEDLKEETLKLRLFSLGLYYYNKLDYDKAIDFFNKERMVLEYNGISEDEKEDLAESNLFLGLCYDKKNEFEKALEFFDITEKYYEKIGDLNFVGDCKLYSSYTLEKMGKLEEALQELEESINIKERVIKESYEIDEKEMNEQIINMHLIRFGLLEQLNLLEKVEGIKPIEKKDYGTFSLRFAYNSGICDAEQDLERPDDTRHDLNKLMANAAFFLEKEEFDSSRVYLWKLENKLKEYKQDKKIQLAKIVLHNVSTKLYLNRYEKTKEMRDLSLAQLENRKAIEIGNEKTYSDIEKKDYENKEVYFLKTKFIQEEQYNEMGEAMVNMNKIIELEENLKKLGN